ncbi:hypothetical protein Tcan_10238 [Toxocara canis]|uniref:Uncharacterized protein n=1 Tax=Toxocara canis TaxID=6265 RepID=A0A0B2UNM6_TOXCA|nr:hypothetical protein Tcan_10238 [Toxocara canis]
MATAVLVDVDSNDPDPPQSSQPLLHNAAKRKTLQITLTILMAHCCVTHRKSAICQTNGKLKIDVGGWLNGKAQPWCSMNSLAATSHKDGLREVAHLSCRHTGPEGGSKARGNGRNEHFIVLKIVPWLLMHIKASVACNEGAKADISASDQNKVWLVELS